MALNLCFPFDATYAVPESKIRINAGLMVAHVTRTQGLRHASLNHIFCP